MTQRLMIKTISQTFLDELLLEGRLCGKSAETISLA